jgi:hypothetical protein
MYDPDSAYYAKEQENDVYEHNLVTSRYSDKEIAEIGFDTLLEKIYESMY